MIVAHSMLIELTNESVEEIRTGRHCLAQSPIVNALVVRRNVSPGAIVSDQVTVGIDDRRSGLPAATSEPFLGHDGRGRGKMRGREGMVENAERGR